MNYHRRGDMNRCTLVGIDPGTTYMGLACIEINAATLQVLHCESTMLSAASGYDSRIEDIHGPKVARLQHLKAGLARYLVDFNPRYVFCEDAYYNASRPSAYGALIESIDAVRQVLWGFDPYTCLNLVTSSEAKACLDIRGRGAEVKDMVRMQLASCVEVADCYRGCMVKATEHGLDALLIAYAGLQQLRATVTHQQSEWGYGDVRPYNWQGAEYAQYRAR